MSTFSDTVIVRDITWEDEMDTIEKDLERIASRGKEDKTIWERSKI